ncbi:MAG: hypothetical protein Q9M48_01225 [Rhodobacterales bacterium]|nr:hypothetical protein [Rhodobacterales bacterium]
MASRGSFWPPEMISLMLARMDSIGRLAASCTESADISGVAHKIGNMASIWASIEAVLSWQVVSITGSEA